MPDIMPVSMQDIMYSRKSELREQIVNTYIENIRFSTSFYG